MLCKAYPLNSLKSYKYVVILSEYQGKILLSRHKQRSTWETQGGHIEPGETPLEAAKRELFEESGALEYSISPLCDYWAGIEGTDDWANGMVFRAHIRSLGPLPQSEMAEVCTFTALPKNLTYPDISPVLFAYAAVTIRPAQLGDEAVLAHIQTSSWKAAFRSILAPDLLEELTEISTAQQMYHSILTRRKGHGLLLEISGQPHCIAWWDRAREDQLSDYAELICLHSLPDRWHQGCGTRMMEQVLREAAEAGFTKIMLWVFADNTRAISFYKKHGFQANGTTKSAFGAVEIMMERGL